MERRRNARYNLHYHTVETPQNIPLHKVAAKATGPNATPNDTNELRTGDRSGRSWRVKARRTLNNQLDLFIHPLFNDVLMCYDFVFEWHDNESVVNWKNTETSGREVIGVGDCQLETPSWKLPVGDSQLETPSWKLPVGDSQFETPRWRLPVWNSQLETPSYKLPVGDCQQQTATPLTVAATH